MILFADSEGPDRMILFADSEGPDRMILFADSEGPDQTARMRRLIWAFAVRIQSKTHFRMAQPILCVPIAEIHEA